MTHTYSTLKLRASRFDHGSDIPRQFTCDGQDISPAVTWTAPPQGTGSLALVVEDPDAPAGTWVHWVLYDIPPGERGLPEGIPHDATLPSGARQGMNDFKKVGYGGPCPPPGPPHRYFFRLYALDSAVAVDSGATASELRHAMRGHVLAEAELMGRYRRALTRRSPDSTRGGEKPQRISVAQPETTRESATFRVNACGAPYALRSSDWVIQ